MSTMRCVICKVGETAPGHATVPLEGADGVVVVFRGVPAEVCQTCGEPYLDGPTTDRVLELVRAATASGIHVAVQDYQAA